MRNLGRGGFTLIESLVVAAIIIFMTAIILPNLIKDNSRKQFDSAIQNIVSSLNNARDRSSAWERETVWGVFFERKMCGGSGRGPNYGTYFTNNGYTNSDRIIHRNTLPAAVDYNEALIWGVGVDCYRTIPFSEVSGTLRNNPASIETSTITIYLIKDQSISSTISVSPLGVVTYTQP